MHRLPIYVDIDGTLTDKPQKGGNPILNRIYALQKLIASGQEVVLWTGSGTAYARSFAAEHGLTGAVCVGKPSQFVDDNPNIRPKGAMSITAPEVFFKNL